MLPDARTLVLDRRFDFMWLRLLDVPAALSARRYATGGELVLEVTDDTAVSVAGRYRLDAEGDIAECEPTRARADLTISERALAAAYLGGFGPREQSVAGAVVERTAGALARAETMFRAPLGPWNATSF